MIVDRDSNDIAFMDIATKKIVGRTFLGNNVNPHMVMMSPDGRYVVTGGTRANKAYVIDAKTLELVKVIPVDIAPEHLAFSPDSRWYYQGNPEGDSISVIDMLSLTKIKTIPGLVEPLNTVFLPDGSKAYVGNYGAHWVGVIDVRRHELLKKIQIAEVPGIAKLDPAKYLGEIKGFDSPLLMHLATQRAGVPGCEISISFKTFTPAGLRPTQDYWVRYAMTDMIFAGVFERYPGLRVGSVEHEISWAPHWLKQMDYTYKERPVYSGYKSKEGLLPSDYWHRNLFAVFQEDEVGVQLRHRIGIDNMLWGNDFPHSESTWPRSRKFLEQMFANVPAEDRRKLTCDNAARIFRFVVE